MQAKKSGNALGRNTSSSTLETLKELGASVGQNTVDSLSALGGGVLDQLLGIQENEDAEQAQFESNDKQTKKHIEKKANLFNYQDHHETVIVKDQIKRLIEEIRKEVNYLKQTDKSLLSEVKDIEKIAIDSVGENPGIYQVKFLEIVLRILQSVRMKVGESKTWLSAMVSKKKQRGSLFAAQSKKKGTAYSLSQELSTARSVQ